MNKDDMLEGLRVEALSSDGCGIAKIDGYPVFIKDALPGDIVTAKVIKAKKDMSFGRLMSIDKASEDRVAARCPIARPCGGCAIQELDYDKQLAFKDDKVYNCLLRIGGIPAKILDAAHEAPIGMDKPWRYRNKAQYPIGRSKDGRIIAGFYAGRTHHIVETEECYLNPPEFSVILRTFIRYCEESRIKPYDEITGKGQIRHLVVRKAFGTDQIMVMPVFRSLSGLDARHREALKDALIGIPGLMTIVLNENHDDTNVILGKRTEILHGPGYIEDRLGEFTFRIGPLSFYQVNSGLALRLYEKAMEYADLNRDETVYDLCCGIGTISLFAAKEAGQVFGIEAVPEAIEDARINAGLNGIDNVSFTAARVEDYLKKKEHFTADVVILDPPRSGMERSALDAIVTASPRRIVYISCDPATQARDLKVFLAAGYHLARFVTADQFCQSHHVETCVLLGRESGRDVKYEYIDYVPKDNPLEKKRARYCDIKAWVEENYGFKISSLYIGQVKDMCGLAKERDLKNYGKNRVPKCPPEKVEAIKAAFKHFGIIE